MALPKELVREIIEQNNFQKPGEILEFLKESFKDVLQEMLEAEMDCHFVNATLKLCHIPVKK